MIEGLVSPVTGHFQIGSRDALVGSFRLMFHVDHERMMVCEMIFNLVANYGTN